MPRFLMALLLLTALGVVVYLGIELTFGAGDRRYAHDKVSPREDVERVKREVSEPEDRFPPAATVWKVHGRVTDVSGAVIPGARVGGATTNADGEYALTLPEPAWRYAVSAVGYLPRRGYEVLEGSGPWIFDFELKVAASLFGRVSSPEGAVKGALVYIVSPERALAEENEAVTTATDTNGMYRFPGLPAGVWDVVVRPARHRPAIARDVVIPERGEVRRDFTVHAGRTVKVKLIHGTRKTAVRVADSRLKRMLLPPGGLKALLDGYPGREFYDKVVRTEGSRDVLEFPGLPERALDFEARDPNALPAVVLDTTEPEVTLTLIPSAEVEARIVDAITGDPLEPRITRGDGVEVERRGTVLVLPADQRRYKLTFVLEGYETRELNMPAPAPLDIRMQPLADGATGSFYLLFEPEIPVRVAVIGRNADGRQVWARHADKIDDKKRFEITKVPEGEYSVTVLATGMIPVLLPSVVVSHSIKTTYRVRIQKGGGLEFKITDTDGNLLDKVVVDLRDANDQRIDVNIFTQVSGGRAFVSVNWLPSAATARADSGLAPGAYTLAAGRAGYRPATVEFVILATEVAEVTIALPSR